MLLNDLYVKTIICLTGIVGGIVLLSWAPRIGWIGLLGGGVCFVGSAVWGVQIGLLFRDFFNSAGVADEDDGEAEMDDRASIHETHEQPENGDEQN